ncbi:MAG: hypothetical protein PHI53_02485 [Candidatus Pacebacteria bacterium]|nr:hypothetical protein [Candidatus Paceibacterota bacterium]
MADYSKDQLWDLYESLPKELQKAIFSSENADKIYNIAVKNGLEEENIPIVSKYTGYVLLGIMPPDEFQKTIKKDLKLSEQTAKKIALEINRFIFYPVKNSLEALYRIEIESSPKTLKEKASEPVKKTLKDKYREEVG